MKFLILVISLTLLISPLYADDFIVYPNKGQSEKQMEKDKFACYTWAKDQTGFDPMNIPEATSAPPKEKENNASATRGALGGAAAGAIIGEIADGKGGEGAVLGALTGGLFGSMRRQNKDNENEEAQENWEHQQAAQYAAKRNTYDRAYEACLEGKDYTVK